VLLAKKARNQLALLPDLLLHLGQPQVLLHPGLPLALELPGLKLQAERLLLVVTEVSGEVADVEV
jgi:hypothetical protein